MLEFGVIPGFRGHCRVIIGLSKGLLYGHHRVIIGLL